MRKTSLIMIMLVAVTIGTCYAGNKILTNKSDHYFHSAVLTVYNYTGKDLYVKQGSNNCRKVENDQSVDIGCNHVVYSDEGDHIHCADTSFSMSDEGDPSVKPYRSNYYSITLKKIDEVETYMGSYYIGNHPAAYNPAISYTPYHEGEVAFFKLNVFPFIVSKSL